MFTYNLHSFYATTTLQVAQERRGIKESNGKEKQMP